MANPRRRRQQPKKVYLWLLLVGVSTVTIFLGLQRAHNDERPKMTEKVVLLGDSITQLGWGDGGWAAALAHYYQRRLDVINRGYAGYNTRWILEEVLKSKDYFNGAKLVTVFFGANDASLPEHNFRQHVPLEEYVENLRKILSMIDSKVILICPPPVDHAKRLAYQKERYGDQATGILERTNANAGIYADACERLANDLHLPCVNLWKTMQQHEEWASFLSDGLHLSPSGNTFLATKLFECIQLHYPSLAVTPDPYTGNYGSSGAKSVLISDAPWHDLLGGTSSSSSEG